MKLVLLLSIVFLVSCKSGGGGETATEKVPDNSKPPGDQVEVPVQEPEVEQAPIGLPKVTITTYSLLKTVRAIASQFPSRTVTSKGTCTEHNGNTYCWDDGLHTYPAFKNGAYWYCWHYYYCSHTYWETSQDADGSFGGHCSGGCRSSYFTVPRKVVNYQFDVYFYSQLEVDRVLNTGTAENHECDIDATKIYCPTFTITR